MEPNYIPMALMIFALNFVLFPVMVHYAMKDVRWYFQATIAFFDVGISAILVLISIIRYIWR